MPIIPGHQYIFWFEHYFLDWYDTVTLETGVLFNQFFINNVIPFVAPNADLLFRFDSDDSVNQAGFVLHVEKIGKGVFLIRF